MVDSAGIEDIRRTTRCTSRRAHFSSATARSLRSMNEMGDWQDASPAAKRDTERM